MDFVLLQLIGGLLGGPVSAKMFRKTDIGLVWNAVVGALGGVAGGQLIGALLGSAAASSGLDMGAIIGPLLDGALTGGLAQISVGAILCRLFLRLKHSEGASGEHS